MSPLKPGSNHQVGGHAEPTRISSGRVTFPVREMLAKRMVSTPHVEHANPSITGTNGRLKVPELPMKQPQRKREQPKASDQQVRYMRLLENLTHSEFDTIENRRHVENRISRLKRRAKDLGVPAHKYVPSPVVTYFDASIMNTSPGGGKTKNGCRTDPIRSDLSPMVSTIGSAVRASDPPTRTK